MGDCMVHAVVKKWGNSFGVILPIRIVREIKISENDIVDIQINHKVRKIGQLFGALKTSKSGQQIKDEMRAGWND